MRNKLRRYCKHGIRNDHPCQACEQIESLKATGKCTHGIELYDPAGCSFCSIILRPHRRGPNPPTAIDFNRATLDRLKASNPQPDSESEISLEGATMLTYLVEQIAALHKKFDELAAKQFADPTPDREFLTVREAANYLNVSEQTIYRRKHLHVKSKGGRMIRIRRSTLDRGLREAA